LVISAMWVVGFWFVLQLLSAAFTNPGDPGVAFWAHVGGFAAGVVLTPLFKSSQFPLFGDVRRGPWG
jgi:membrane associated rhomboid family serine protease